jgi:hypothetical protein
MKERLVFVLMLRLLDLLRESGASETEASCALRAAEAIIPEIGLPSKSTVTIET